MKCPNSFCTVNFITMTASGTAAHITHCPTCGTKLEAGYFPANDPNVVKEMDKLANLKSIDGKEK